MAKAKTVAPEKGKAQFPTGRDDEKRLADFLARERRRGLILNRSQAFALLFRRGLDVEEQEARA